MLMFLPFVPKVTPLREHVQYNARQDSMYKVTIDKFANTKIYKLMNKSTWKKIDG